MKRTHRQVTASIGSVQNMKKKKMSEDIEDNNTTPNGPATIHPGVDRRPTASMLSDLILLLQRPGASTRASAIVYLKEWLDLHPPVTPESVIAYSDAFCLNHNNNIIINTIKSLCEDQDLFIAVGFVEFCVLMFQINFDHCLRKGTESVIKSCMIAQWLCVSTDSMLTSSITTKLLSILGDVISTAEPNISLCVSLCSLFSIAAQCVRLVSVQWNVENHNFVEDPVLDIGGDLAKKIQDCLKVNGFDTASIVISSVKPCWLRTLVVAHILSSYNDCLLSEKIQVKQISLSSIVSQYFFLVPALQDRSVTEECSMNGSSSNYSVNSCPPIKPSIFLYRNNGPIKKKPKILKVHKKINQHGETAVHMACKKNNVEKLKQLLAEPWVDVNIKDKNGFRPLHDACFHGSYDCVMLLLEYVPNTAATSSAYDDTAGKVDINAVADGGYTPLMEAVCKNHVEICKQLLKYGGKQLLEAKNKDGHTALDLADISEEMTELLTNATLSTPELDPDLERNQEIFFQPTSFGIQSINEDDSLFSLYEKNIGDKYVLKKNCHDFLSLLTSLVCSYFMSMSSHSSSFGASDMSEREISVLRNMKDHLMKLRRHVERLTKSDDHKDLYFQLELLESVCNSITDTILNKNKTGIIVSFLVN